MASVLKKINVNLELLTDINILLIEAGIRREMCQSVTGMLKQIINT